MEYSSSTQFDIFEIYRRFCVIKSGNVYPIREASNILSDDSAKCSREAIFQLSKTVPSNLNSSLLMDELRKLLSCLDVMGDFSEFSIFYDFVFFTCRENGQKNITVSRAIAAWRLVLSGRFRLLSQWCEFVEKNQQYNISEDTWRQVLAFSRCVHEDLEGYDPEGAWPTLIDDFVEHMYRIIGSNNCSSRNPTCTCEDPNGEPSMFDEPLPGLKNLPGLKRKFQMDLRRNNVENNHPSEMRNSIVYCKRRKQIQQKTVKVNSINSHCAVEGCLLKGFSGLLSSPHVQNQEQRTWS